MSHQKVLCLRQTFNYATFINLMKMIVSRVRLSIEQSYLSKLHEYRPHCLHAVTAGEASYTKY